MRSIVATLLLLSTITPSLHALRRAAPQGVAIVDKPLTQRSLDIKDYKPGDAYQAMVSFASNFTGDMLHFTSDQRKAEFYEKLEKWNALVDSAQKYIDKNGTPEEQAAIKKLGVISAKFFDSLGRLHGKDVKKVLQEDIEKWQRYLKDTQEIFISLVAGLPLSKDARDSLKYKKVAAIIPNFDQVISAYSSYKGSEKQDAQAFIAKLLNISKARTIEKLVENLEKAAYLTKSDAHKNAVVEIVKIVRATKLPALNPSDTQKITDASQSEKNKSRLVLIGIAFSLQIALQNALNAAPRLPQLISKAKLKDSVKQAQDALDRLKEAAQKAQGQ